MNRFVRWIRLRLVLLAVASLCGCASGPLAAPSATHAADVTFTRSESFDLSVSEANAVVRSGAGQSCVLVQSDGATRVVGHALVQWSARPPNPAALRVGWFDDDHLPQSRTISGPSPLDLGFNGTARGPNHALVIFVGATNDSPLVYDQPASATVNLTAEGDALRLYVSSCAVN
ncbi:MAG: hypothetical protein QOE90_3539 [Thermoplasmata archaeon]|jgi:predicted small lipoprotein YifL|nr:hypothetical protein [Thermoplasmata archaeon]